MQSDPCSDDKKIEARMLLLESRLIKQYGDGSDLDDCYIRNAIRDACREFADARLRDFVPILVERAVRRKLAQRSIVSAHASDGAPQIR